MYVYFSHSIWCFYTYIHAFVWNVSFTNALVIQNKRDTSAFSRLRQTQFVVFHAWSEFPTKRRQLSRQNAENSTRRLRIQSSPAVSQCYCDSIWCSTPSKFASILRTQACDDNSACVPSKFLKGKYFLACGAPWRRVTIASDECPYTFT